MTVDQLVSALTLSVTWLSCNELLINLHEKSTNVVGRIWTGTILAWNFLMWSDKSGFLNVEMLTHSKHGIKMFSIIFHPFFKHLFYHERILSRCKSEGVSALFFKESEDQRTKHLFNSDSFASFPLMTKAGCATEYVYSMIFWWFFENMNWGNAIGSYVKYLF